jgi:hypothetical protein
MSSQFWRRKVITMRQSKSRVTIRREYKQAVENLKEAAAALYGDACLFDLDVLLQLIAGNARKGAYSSKSRTTGIS